MGSADVFSAGIIGVFMLVPPILDYALASRVGGFSARSAFDDPEFRRVVGLIALADMLAITAGLFATPFDLPGNTWAWLVLGIALMCVGNGLRCWAILSLGQFFRFVVAIQSDHRVITGGPYRLVRHPAYLGIVLIQLGIGIANANSLSLLLCIAIPMLGLVRRIQREELALFGDLGTEYAAYAAGTKRLIPKVW